MMQTSTSVPTAAQHLMMSSIEGLKSKRSSGYDGLFYILLKQIKCEISPYVTLLLNQCLTTGIFPEKLKIAKNLPIFKK